MRIRTIKPSFWRDEKVVSLSINARLLFIGLLNVADDYGIFENNPKLIKADLFPLDDDIRIDDLNKWIDELVKARITVPLTFETKGYQYIRTFREHQRINRPSESGCISREKLVSFLRENGETGELCTFQEISVSLHGVLIIGIGKGKGRGRGKEVSKSEFSMSAEKQLDDPIQEEEKKDPPVAAIPPKEDFLNQIIGAFAEKFKSSRGFDYIILNRGKERMSAGKLSGLVRNKYPELDTEGSLQLLSDFFDRCLTIDDDWLYRNMSLSIIISKFNEINTYLNEPERKKHKQPATSNDDLARIFARSAAGVES
jgi:hypothetical protein